MADHDEETFIEFTQSYDGGARVKKRGMVASPMVERKYDLGDEEVIAFTSWLADNQALTAFHFHPSFPAENRRDYMRQHLDGVALLEEVQAKKELGEGTRLKSFVSQWKTALVVMDEVRRLLVRLARLVVRPRKRAEARESEAGVSELKIDALNPVLPASAPLVDKQRRALPESFGKAGALPHWERGYENGALSTDEVIALKEDRRRDQEGRPISRTVH